MTPTIQPKQPETLAQFLLLLGRGFLSGLKWKLLLAAVVTFLAWVFHTYLLVVVNEGFNAGTNPTLDLILALSDRLTSAVLVWTLFTALFTALFWRMVRVGVGPTLRAIFGTPGWLRVAFRRAGLMSLAILFVGGMAFGLLLATLWNQRLLSLQLALLGSGILIVRENGLLFMALSLGWSDLQRWVKRQSPTVLNLYGVGLAVCGLTLGLWLAVVLPFYPYFHGALVVLMLLGMVALFVGGVFRPGHFLILVFFLALAFAVAPALADDGGWSESGGTLSAWLTSEGAVRALAQGLFPAVGAGLGVLLGAMAGSATTGLAGSPLSSGLSGRSVPAGKMSKGSEPASMAPAPEIHQRHRPEPDLSHSQKAPPEQPTIARHEPAGVSAGQKGEQPVIARHEPAEVSAGQKGSESPQTLITRHQTRPSAGQKAETPAMAEQAPNQPTPHPRATPAGTNPAEQIEEILQGDEPANPPPASQAGHDPAGAEQAKMVAPERMGQERGATGTPGRYGEGQSPHPQPIEPTPPQPPPPASQASQAEMESHFSTPSKVTDKAAPQPKAAVEPPLSGASQAPPPGEMGTGLDKGNEGKERIRPGEMGLGPTKGNPQTPPTLVGGVPIIPATFHWQITMTAGYATGRSFPLSPTTIIGRGRDCDIQLLDPKASRQHAQITLQGHHCQISDLNSRNGTYVNKQPISQPTPLYDGDLVRIGDTQFQINLKS